MDGQIRGPGPRMQEKDFLLSGSTGLRGGPA